MLEPYYRPFGESVNSLYTDESLVVKNVVTTLDREIVLHGCASGIMSFKKEGPPDF